MKETINTRYTKQLLLAAIGTALLIYAFIRAASMSFTIDEAFTFQRYVKNSDFFPQEYDMHTANFHMLNTWLMIICSKIFGIAEWSLRLPGVLAYGLYLFFTAKLALKSKQTWSAVALFILLNVHPYMIDFFSVARGYALLLGFEAASLWYVCEYFTKGRQFRHLVLTLIFAGLGMWANFVGLMVFSAIALIVFVGIVFTKEITTRRKIGGVAILALIFIPFAAVAYYVIAQLQQVNAFFWGNGGFWDETVCVLGAKLAYPQDSTIYTIPHADSIVMLIVLLVPGIIVGYSAFRNRRSPEATELFILLALFGIVLLQAVVQHAVMQSPYPSGRTALFLFVIFLWILAVAFRDTMLPRYVSLSVCIAAVSVQLWYALPAFNLTHTLEWQNCESVKQATYDLMDRDYKPDAVYPGITVSSDMEFGNIIAYYMRLRNVRNVSLINCPPGQREPGDYFIISRFAQHEIPVCDTLRDYSTSGLLLLRNSTYPPLHLQQGTAEIARTACTLKAAEDLCWLCTHNIVTADSGLGRLNVTATVKFARRPAAGLFLIWHDRDGKNIWSSFVSCDVPEDSLTATVTASRTLPLKVQTGDVIKVTMVPYNDPGPIEISNVHSTVYVEK